MAAGVHLDFSEVRQHGNMATLFSAAALPTLFSVGLYPLSLHMPIKRDISRSGTLSPYPPLCYSFFVLRVF